MLVIHKASGVGGNIEMDKGIFVLQVDGFDGAVAFNQLLHILRASFVWQASNPDFLIADLGLTVSEPEGRLDGLLLLLQICHDAVARVV